MKMFPKTMVNSMRRAIVNVLVLLILGASAFVAADQLDSTYVRTYSVDYLENMPPVLDSGESLYANVNETSETPYLHFVQNSSWQWKILTFEGIVDNVTVITTPSATYHFPINETTAGYIDGWIPYLQKIQVSADTLTVKGIITRFEFLEITEIMVNNDTIYHWNPYSNGIGF